MSNTCPNFQAKNDRQSDEAILKRIIGTDFWIRINYNGAMGDKWIRIVEEKPKYYIINSIFYHGYDRAPRPQAVKEAILRNVSGLEKSKIYVCRPVELSSTDELFPEQ